MKPSGPCVQTPCESNQCLPSASVHVGERSGGLVPQRLGPATAGLTASVERSTRTASRRLTATPKTACASLPALSWPRASGAVSRMYQHGADAIRICRGRAETTSQKSADAATKMLQRRDSPSCAVRFWRYARVSLQRLLYDLRAVGCLIR